MNVRCLYSRDKAGVGGGSQGDTTWGVEGAETGLLDYDIDALALGQVRSLQPARPLHLSQPLKLARATNTTA